MIRGYKHMLFNDASRVLEDLIGVLCTSKNVYQIPQYHIGQRLDLLRSFHRLHYFEATTSPCMATVLWFF
jgi:hypothetical protein